MENGNLAVDEGLFCRSIKEGELVRTNKKKVKIHKSKGVFSLKEDSVFLSDPVRTHEDTPNDCEGNYYNIE